MPREESLLRAKAMLPRLKQKILRSKGIIARLLEQCEKPYLAWSGGKDSTFMLWLTRQLRPDIEAIYFDAQSCLPDTWKFMQRLVEQWEINFRAVETEPMLDVLERYGLDNPKVEYYTMKATVRDPIKRLREEGYDGALVGVRAAESFWRRFTLGKHGDLRWQKQDGMYVCWPIARWTTEEIWAAIDFFQLPYSPDYDKTAFCEREQNRTSYWAGETYRTHGRYQWLKYYYPELFNRLARRIPEARKYV